VDVDRKKLTSFVIVAHVKHLSNGPAIPKYMLQEYQSEQERIITGTFYTLISSRVRLVFQVSKPRN
jgi:hypothetical protein